LLVDGPTFFGRMLEAIAASRRSVIVELYLVESGAVADRFIAALSAAAARGVTVIVLLDAFGAMGLKAADRERLLDGGVRLEFYNPLHWRKRLGNLLRDHRKLLLVDGVVGFVGGAGLTDEFDPVHEPALRWRETMIEIQGPVLADWHALFLRVWQSCGLAAPTLPQPEPVPIAGGMAGRVAASERLHRLPVTRAVVARVRTAERRAWIATAYFTPSWTLRRALRAAARRGVDVRLLVPGHRVDHPTIRYAGRRMYASLLRHGVRIFEYQPRFLHAKVVLVDDWSSIGSSNHDRWNLHWNLEANQEIDAPAFAAEVAGMLLADLDSADEIHWADWRRRGPRARLLEWIGGLVDRALRGLRR
jgi:phosphatidylserine/phosphatidylglycerophosphate/cardiolipin synthase-like enzyme